MKIQKQQESRAEQMRPQILKLLKKEFLIKGFGIYRKGQTDVEMAPETIIEDLLEDLDYLEAEDNEQELNVFKKVLIEWIFADKKGEKLKGAVEFTKPRFGFYPKPGIYLLDKQKNSKIPHHKVVEAVNDFIRKDLSTDQVYDIIALTEYY